MIRARVIASKRKLHIAERDISRAKKSRESLANPLGSLQVRLQAVPRSVAERASELGVLLVHYSKPGSAHRKPTNGFVVGFEKTEH